MPRLSKITHEEQIFLHIRNGKRYMVEKFIFEGGNVNKTTWSGWSLLHRAAEQGHTEICVLLVESGANINARSALGWFTPLHCCLANGYVDTAEILVELGASMYLTSKSKDTAVQWATKRGYRELALEWQDRVLRIQSVKILRQRQDATVAAARKAEEEALAAEEAAEEEAQRAAAAAANVSDGYLDVTGGGEESEGAGTGAGTAEGAASPPSSSSPSKNRLKGKDKGVTERGSSSNSAERRSSSPKGRGGSSKAQPPQASRKSMPTAAGPTPATGGRSTPDGRRSPSPAAAARKL